MKKLALLFCLALLLTSISNSLAIVASAEALVDDAIDTDQNYDYFNSGYYSWEMECFAAQYCSSALAEVKDGYSIVAQITAGPYGGYWDDDLGLYRSESSGSANFVETGQVHAWANCSNTGWYALAIAIVTW